MCDYGLPFPLWTNQIEELYVLAAHARNQSQEFIPVHIFPVQFKNPKSAAHLSKIFKGFSRIQQAHHTA